jgi:ADP-ribose pyrophosphatase YjhB (NUDIX family)
VEEGEEFKSAIEREIKEEIDLNVEAKELVKTFEDEDPTLKIKVFLYECMIIDGEPKPLDCKDLGFFSFRDIERLDLAPADKKIFAYLKQLKTED